MTGLKELLARVRESSQKLREKQAESIAQYGAVADRLDLNAKKRSENLRLLRAFMDEYQEDFKRLVMIGSQSTYSKIESGEVDFPARSARQIESELDLPIGWFDRDNGSGLFLTNDELNLVQELRKSPLDATEILLKAIQSLRSTKDDV